VLELGCDTGTDTAWLLEHGRPRSRASTCTTSTGAPPGSALSSCKRFFDAGDLDRLFPPEEWETLAREERTVLRHAQPKIAWELVLRAIPAST
jgi:hypothetical protein